MQNFKKWLCVALASLTLLSSAAVFAGCADTTDGSGETEQNTTASTEAATKPSGATETAGETNASSETNASDATAPSESGSAGETAAPVESNNPDETTVTTEAPVETEDFSSDTRFDGVNYNNRPFRVHTSIHIASPGMGNSNFLIEGSNKIEGSLVNDAVLERNIAVEEALGIKLEFYQCDKNYDTVPAEVRTIVTAGDDEYDLIINDLFPFANLCIEGQFRNTLDPECVFDFERSYWYGDYMEDLRLMDGYQHMLAGDYFIDVLRSAHLLLLNKEIYNDYYQKDPDELYDIVINYEWTYDKMNEVITGVYKDSNANGEKDKGDQFGFITPEYWGGSIGYSISGNPTFIERDPDTGEPTVILGQGDRANQLGSAMAMIFNGDYSSVSMTSDADLLQAFANDECLILDYQRLGSLENPVLRSMEGDACVLPLPMLHASDKKYTTAAHDTTEVGAILATSTDLEFISTVIEVLNRETARVVMPKYYKDGLQVQYVDDSKAALMIDIIHDNFDNSFALAFNEALGQMMLQPFYIAMQEKREFSAVYAKNDMKIARKMGQIVEKYEKNNVK